MVVTLLDAIGLVFAASVSIVALRRLEQLARLLGLRGHDDLAE